MSHEKNGKPNLSQRCTYSGKTQPRDTRKTASRLTSRFILSKSGWVGHQNVIIKLLNERNSQQDTIEQADISFQIWQIRPFECDHLN
jgi:hypothetical protein